MKLSLVPLLRCPRCSGSPLAAHDFDSVNGRCRSGVLVCESCSAWYPISDFVLELLPEGAEEPGRREEFFRRHRASLEPLGLRPSPGEQEQRDLSFTPQIKQREHFDALARRDDKFSYRALGRMPFQQGLRDLTFGEWRPMLQPRSVVLDIGCADGLSTFRIARPDLEVIAFDISREAIVLATAEAEANGMHNVTFFVGDADTIPLQDESVDCVLCYGSLHHVPAPPRTLAEAERLMKPGGLYFGVENNRTPLRPIFDLVMRVSPLWKEEAGAEAQIGQADLERWTAGSSLRLTSRAIVFVPPHLCNRLGVPAARRLLRFTDGVFGRIPFIRRWGGLVAILGRKQAPVRQIESGSQGHETRVGAAMPDRPAR